MPSGMLATRPQMSDATMLDSAVAAFKSGEAIFDLLLFAFGDLQIFTQLIPFHRLGMQLG